MRGSRSSLTRSLASFGGFGLGGLVALGDLSLQEVTMNSSSQFQPVSMCKLFPMRKNYTIYNPVNAAFKRYSCRYCGVTSRRAQRQLIESWINRRGSVTMFLTAAHCFCISICIVLLQELLGTDKNTIAAAQHFHVKFIWKHQHHNDSIYQLWMFPLLSPEVASLLKVSLVYFHTRLHGRINPSTRKVFLESLTRTKWTFKIGWNVHKYISTVSRR